MEARRSVWSGMIESFLRGNFTVLLVVVSLAAGAVALRVTPREEEPQIVVPLADVLVTYPGGSAGEVERLVSSRLERLLHQIDGVEYVYSMSRPGMAVVTVRFFVGEDREASLIKLYNKIFQNIDRTTPGISGWVVKPIEIDDVPVVNVALYSRRYGTPELHRVAEQVVSSLQAIPDTANITIHGGEPRVVHVYVDPARVDAYGLSPAEIAGALQVSNAQMEAGAFEQGNRTCVVEAGPFLRDAREVADLVVGLHGDRPVYLRDVAEVVDGPAETTAYTRIGFGAASAEGAGGDALPAVTVAVAKKKGSNAVRVAADVKRAVESLRGGVIPDEVETRITRDYGATADDKVNDLVGNLALGIVTVVGLIALAMSWREGVIVGLAIPVTYSLTLLLNYLLGFTINRVTLFALILSLGLLVDNPIVSVENIQRYLAMRRHGREQAVSLAMNEVMPPIVLATLAIIVSFLPMFFISGMMGPYMAPMALNVPLTMLCSMLVAFAVTPWLSSRLLRAPPAEAAACDVRSTRTFAVYRRVVEPLIDSRGRSAALLLAVAALFALSVLLAATGRVPLKMLPFDNKNEFQLVVDLPESATLEETDAAVRRVEAYLRTVPEVVDFSSTVGAGSPMDFNGLVRHYYLRRGPHVADVRVNLLHRARREADSHALVLRIRERHRADRGARRAR